MMPVLLDHFVVNISLVGYRWHTGWFKSSLNESSPRGRVKLSLLRKWHSSLPHPLWKYISTWAHFFLVTVCHFGRSLLMKRISLAIWHHHGIIKGTMSHFRWLNPKEELHYSTRITMRIFSDWLWWRHCLPRSNELIEWKCSIQSFLFCLLVYDLHCQDCIWTQLFDRRLA